MTPVTVAQGELVRQWRREYPDAEFRALVAGGAMFNDVTEEELMAEAERTALQFEATLKDVKVYIPKEVTGYGATKPNGGLLLTLRIERPKPPTKPAPSHQLQEPYGHLSLKSIGPEPTRKKAKESDEDYQARLDEWAALMVRRKEAIAEDAAHLEAWQRKQEAWGDVLRAYASITGLAAAFGDSPIAVSLTPLQTDFFAGMGVLSLPSARLEEEVPA